MPRFHTYLLAALIVILLAMQARLLYIFPAPDSARWWGDETGQMLELRAELQDGHARIPTALGSSLEVSNGFVRSNSWFAAIIYGAPVLLLDSTTDVVTIGRTITFLLSLLLCALMLVIMRRLAIDDSVGLLAILLLISTRSFFFASHAARLDIAVAISVLLFVFSLSKQYEKFRQNRWTPTVSWCFLYSAMAMGFATLSIHLLTLLGLLSLFVIFQFSIYRNVRLIIACAAGVVSVIAVLSGIYLLSGAPLTLFSTSVGPNQFQSVASGLPILRPLSRSVQIANISERITGLWSEARMILIVGVLTIVVATSRRQASRSPKKQFLTRATVVLIVAWLFFQSPALYYFIHILPIVAVWFAAIVAERVKLRDPIIIGLAVAFAYVGVRDTMIAAPLAKAIAHNNRPAIDSTLNLIGANIEHPTVLAQNPAIAQVEHAKNVRLMTPHFLDFATRNETPLQTIKRVGVRYALLYAPADRKSYSSDYAVLRPLADSAATVRARIPGMLLDANRDYFSTEPIEQQLKDTLILYEFAR